MLTYKAAYQFVEGGVHDDVRPDGQRRVQVARQRPDGDRAVVPRRVRAERSP